MERSVEGDCHNTSDSKSSGLELKGIGLSVNLNLPLPVIVNGGDCQKISIRQYVAETEKKDIKICPPFGSSSNLSKQLPSSDVSKHKRWWCANYTHKIGDDESAEDKINDGFVNARSTNFVSKDGDRVDETNNIATEMMLSKKCLNREIETNIPVLKSVDAPMNKGIKISQKKRNMFQKNDCGFGIDNLDGKSAKKSKVFDQNQEVVRISMENIVTNSCSRDNRYDRDQYCLLSDSESVKIKRKKHNQQAQVVSGCSLHFPFKEKNSGLVTNRSSANIFIQAPHGSPSIKKVECHLRNDNISLHTKKDCDLRNLLEDAHDSSHMNVVQDKNLQGGNFSKGEDVLQKSIGMGMMTSQLESELYLKEKLVQTLNNFKNAQKNIENDTIQKKNILYYPSTILKDNKSCYPLKANGVESNQSFEKRVIPRERQPTMVQPDQSSRNGFINLNHTIDLTNKQEIYISLNSLQQNQKLMEVSDPANRINIYGIQDQPHVTIPQRNQQTMKDTERGSSIYIPSIDNMEMFKNRHERSNLLIQNGMLPYINPVSTNFHPLYANVGFHRGSTAMTQFKEQPIKLSNSMQVSSVSTRWGLQNVERSNPVKLSIAQDTTFQSYNLQNNQNRESHKCGQVSLGSLQKGKTISDLKSVHSIKAEDMRTKGMRSLNSFSSEGMSATQLCRYQKGPFTSYNIHHSFLMHENPGIYNEFLLPHHQLKEFFGVYIGDFIEVQSSRQHISYLKEQGVSLRSQEKKRKAHALEQFDGTKLQQSGLSSGLLHKTRDSGPKVDLMQNDNIFKTLDLGGYSTPATVLPVSSIHKKDPPCLFNQNPTDIVDVDYERYFRTADDQSIRDSSSLQRKFVVDIKLDGRQRQRRNERPGRMPVVGFKS